MSKGWARAQIKEAQHYQRGDIVRFGHSYKTLEAAKGEYLTVAEAVGRCASASAKFAESRCGAGSFHTDTANSSPVVMTAIAIIDSKWSAEKPVPHFILAAQLSPFVSRHTARTKTFQLKSDIW
ncbi:hypothetical protein GJ698_00770 [Pseudoduganella sp. FT26W]|uniref:Uncharacterized protein n=1 Tax=Duganella aquatilis TaxID=2666082 RepID=A0A844CQV2_9BURK|nr:hypothetical protein [Duganella aquatilis]MRW82623.1 hypothetical protein [Duganella aquatilis]